MQALDDTMITGEPKYSINITKSKKVVCLSLNYNGNESFLYANRRRTYQFKGKKFRNKLF